MWHLLLDLDTKRLWSHGQLFPSKKKLSNGCKYDFEKHIFEIFNEICEKELYFKKKYKICVAHMTDVLEIETIIEI